MDLYPTPAEVYRRGPRTPRRGQNKLRLNACRVWGPGSKLCVSYSSNGTCECHEDHDHEAAPQQAPETVTEEAQVPDGPAESNESEEFIVPALAMAPWRRPKEGISASGSQPSEPTPSIDETVLPEKHTVSEEPPLAVANDEDHESADAGQALARAKDETSAVASSSQEKPEAEESVAAVAAVEVSKAPEDDEATPGVDMAAEESAAPVAASEPSKIPEEAVKEVPPPAACPTPSRNRRASGGNSVRMAPVTGSMSWDYPLSRTEKKERLLQLYATDLACSNQHMGMLENKLEETKTALRRVSMGASACPSPGTEDDSD